MKTVLYLLFFANLILFGWLYSNPTRFAPQLESRVSPLPMTVEPLYLLSERAKTNTEPAQLVEGAVVSKPENPAGLGMGESTASAPASSDIEPDPTPEGAAAGASEIEVPAPAPVCQAIGPFPKRVDVERLQVALKARQLTLNVRTAQMEYPADYWVYLSEMSAAEARAIMQDLADKGVRDTFLGRQNFISLGVFSDKRTAENRARDIRQHGYDPKVEARFRTRDVFWVDVEERPPAFLSEDEWQVYLADWPDIRRQQVSCE